MSESIKSNQLRARLNSLDSMLSRGSVQSNLRTVAAKVYVGEDAIHGDRG